jgi:hypothetical protein
MSDPHDLQHFVDETHVWAEHLLKHGACPSCLAHALISEGFHLAGTAGALPLAKEVADRYANGDGGPVFSTQ